MPNYLIRTAAAFTARYLPLLLLTALAAAPANAQVITFDNGCVGNSNWDCADNWDLNRVPQAGDDVVIGSFNVTGVFTSASVNSLALNSTTLNTDGPMSVGQLDWTSGRIKTVRSSSSPGRAASGAATGPRCSM